MTLPTALDIERLANAMAAANGVDFIKADPEFVWMLRRAASGALVWLALDKTVSADRHLSQTLEGIIEALRATAQAMEEDAGGTFREDQIKAMYAQAASAEMVARVLMCVEGSAPATEEAI